MDKSVLNNDIVNNKFHEKSFNNHKNRIINMKSCINDSKPYVSKKLFFNRVKKLKNVQVD